MKYIKYIAAIVVPAMVSVSCDDFLDRPTEDNYNVDNYYQTDDQCIAGVNYLYNSPWYDFQRGFFKIGEIMSGNYYMGSSPYLNFTTNGTDEDLVNMSYSLWAVNGHCNTVIMNINNASGPSQSAKDQCIGEALTWKAMAYFYLVRNFGAVPIIHDNNATLTSNTYNDVRKVNKEDVYEYIIMTLEKAMELLPKATSFDGRIDYYSAEGLLAKVYLTRSGVTGTRSESDLAKAAEYAKDVIDNSGRSLTPEYSDIFRLSTSTYNQTGEPMISWLWSASRNPWTQQNTLQSDLGIVGFDEYGDVWGGYGGMSVDLQDAFGASVLDDPSSRLGEKDSRRKATMMMPGDVYEYFWTDKGGFDYIRFLYDSDDYGKGGPGLLQSATGSNTVKHLYGDAYDHQQATGVSAANMCSQLPTHILRLADVYLIYAEAKLGTAASTTDADALAAFNAVRSRAGVSTKESITWDDIWKERRLELAMEGDRWYDYVRRSYYDMDGAIAELKAQRRNCYWGLSDLYESYYNTGSWDKALVDAVQYEPVTSTPIPNVTASSFTLPFPSEDVVFNPNLNKDPIHVDVRSTYSYDF